MRHLAGEAHEAELAAALVDVERAIAAWRRGDILPGEVKDRIHQFHKRSQDIYKTYYYTDVEFAIARAVFLKFVALSEVPERVRPRIEQLHEVIAGGGA